MTSPHCTTLQRKSRRAFHHLLSGIVLASILVWCGCAGTALANNAGGFVSTITTAVTTGTETFGSQTNRFLDNGILHVSVGPTGSVYSIKYLKPGLTGTPKANGTEMVSQFGMSNPSFGNHYNIYYYWYPDTNVGAVYLNTITTATNIDLAYKRTYSSSRDQVPVDMEIHYALDKGNTALYVYLVANHPASYSAYADMNLQFIQMIWPVAHDATNFLCENMYIDSVKTDLSRNGVQQMRQALEPTFADTAAGVVPSGFPPEISQLTSGPFNGQLNGKYSGNVNYAQLGTWGRASEINHVGQWVVAGSHEFVSNGPTVRDYVNGWGLMYYMPVGGHYTDTGITVAKDKNWTKVLGPWALYFNSPTTGAAGWQDAQAQAVAEKQAWPYAWVNNASYQTQSQRATVTGKLVINDALRPGSSAAGAWIGLAAADAGGENAPDNWQYQSDGYQHWVQAAADGTFTIPNVRTDLPTGGTAAYRLYAYSAGTSPTTGSMGEFSTGPVAVTAGATTSLGTLTWNVPHQGVSTVWEIGIPDRTAAEFKHGDEYAKPGLWLQYASEFANPLEYNAASNNWATALNYCHSVDFVGTAPWKWHINFTLTSVVHGTYYLNIAYASPSSVQIIRVNDDSTAFATFTPANGDPGQTTFLRQGIQTKYSVAHVAIPWNKLRVGNNTITLDHELHTNHGTAHFMYDYLNLEAPVAPVLPPGRDLIWKGGASANQWESGTTNNWVVSGTTTPNVAFANGDRPLFDDTGSNSPSINLSAPFAPGSLTLNATTKNYTLIGAGFLQGAMEFVKSGPGTLTLSPTQISATTTTTNGSPAVTLTSTTGLLAGFNVTGTGIAAGTTIASVDSATALTLSKNATADGSVTLVYGAASTYFGGTTINSGNVTLTNDTANKAAFGTGPITFNAGSVTMFSAGLGTFTGPLPNDLAIYGNALITTAPRCGLSGAVSGSGNLTLYIPYLRTDLTGNWALFTGNLFITTDSDGGDLRLGNASGYAGTAIHLPDKITTYYNAIPAVAGTTVDIGELSGTAASKFKGSAIAARVLTWRIGARGTDATFAGDISEQTPGSTVTAITKTGTGTWTLSGNHTYAGTTTVAAGTLTLSGTIASNATCEILDSATLNLAGGTLSVGQINVHPGGALIGSGNIAGPLNNSGTVAVSSGTLSVNGNASNSGTLRITGGAALAVSGTLNNSGVLDLMTSASPVPANLVNTGTVLTASSPKVENIIANNGTFVLSIQSYAGHNYQLERSPTLAQNSWAPVGNAQSGTDDILVFIDPTPTAGKGFYRITLSP